MENISKITNDNGGLSRHMVELIGFSLNTSTLTAAVLII